MNRCGERGRSTGIFVSAIALLRLGRCVPNQSRNAPQSASPRRSRLSSMANMMRGHLAGNTYFAYLPSAECEGNRIPHSQPRLQRTMRFDLTDLSLFRPVVEAGSITGGAARGHLALAAASTRIRNMEEALGA